MINLNYNGHEINQRESDGYVNATQICQANNKKISHWMANKETKAYINGVASVAGIPVRKLVITIQGGVPSSQGTWIHPKLAICLGRWISAGFAFWVDQHIASSHFVDIQFSRQKCQKNSSGFIYLAIAAQTRWCKIGMSKQPYKRMLSLQTGSPLVITLIHRIFTFDMVALEKALHDYYSAYSLRGEWFDLPAECIREFPAIANELDASLEQAYLPQ